ncbi:MAG: membrane protein insertion efficiency factor YidD [Acidimicrobiales bacterium]
MTRSPKLHTKPVPTWFTWIAMFPIKAYQLARSGRPSPCRYIPSCSDYALTAIATHGVFRGWWMAIRRVLRCRPGGGFGFDPVPDREAE